MGTRIGLAPARLQAVGGSLHAAVACLAWPLVPADRGPFLQAVAAKLAEAPELLGDGHVARVAVEIQRRFWTPPDLNVSRLKSKERLVPYFSRLYARDLFPADAGPA